jgi:hypothetical protein
VELLRAAAEAGTLAQLASLSKQLCRLARSSVPVTLRVENQEQAGWIIKIEAAGVATFSACTGLCVSADDPEACALVEPLLGAAQNWTALQKLQLCIFRRSWEEQQQQQQQEERPVLDYHKLLNGMAALQRMRCLEIDVPTLDAGSAQHIMQLTQLTSLRLTARNAPAGAAAAAAAAAVSAAAAADLGAMAGMTSLVKLRLNWALAPHLPAGPEGPYCLPSSLVRLELCSYGHTSPAPMACWIAHLPGCPQLQHLELASDNNNQHGSTHPSVVVGLLAQHNKQLRRLDAFGGSSSGAGWEAPVEGLPDAPFALDWRPSAALAALKDLSHLVAGEDLGLSLRTAADWQHLAQLPALTELECAMVLCVPPPQQQLGATLQLLELDYCRVELGGADLGRLLLACPVLQRASIQLCPMDPPAAASGARLPSHSSLADVVIGGCEEWGTPVQAAAQFAALAPVLSGVLELDLYRWPLPDARSDMAMPDLSACSALTALDFMCEGRGRGDTRPVPEQEDFVSMLAPAKQLQRLMIEDAPRLNARVAFPLQSILPKLSSVLLSSCGKLLPAKAVADSSSSSSSSDDEDDDSTAEEEEAALIKLTLLLRPGMDVSVYP